MENEFANNLQQGHLTEKIIGCCFDVMNELGLGFLEAVYKNALIVLLRDYGFVVHQEVPFDILFRGKTVGRYKADIIVDNKVIVELKCHKSILPEHKAQVINYLKASGLTTGLLVNFGQNPIEIKRLYK